MPEPVEEPSPPPSDEDASNADLQDLACAVSDLLYGGELGWTIQPMSNTIAELRKRWRRGAPARLSGKPDQDPGKTEPEAGKTAEEPGKTPPGTGITPRPWSIGMAPHYAGDATARLLSEADYQHAVRCVNVAWERGREATEPGLGEPEMLEPIEEVSGGVEEAGPAWFEGIEEEESVEDGPKTVPEPAAQVEGDMGDLETHLIGAVRTWRNARGGHLTTELIEKIASAACEGARRGFVGEVGGRKAPVPAPSTPKPDPPPAPPAKRGCLSWARGEDGKPQPVGHIWEFRGGLFWCSQCGAKRRVVAVPGRAGADGCVDCSKPMPGTERVFMLEGGGWRCGRCAWPADGVEEEPFEKAMKKAREALDQLCAVPHLAPRRGDGTLARMLSSKRIEDAEMIRLMWRWMKRAAKGEERKKGPGSPPGHADT